MIIKRIFIIIICLITLNLSAQETDDSYIPLINKQGNQTWVYDTWEGEGPSSYNRLTMDNQDSVIDRVSYIVVHSYRYDTYYHYQGIEDTVVEEDFLLMKKVFVLIF